MTQGPRQNHFEFWIGRQKRKMFVDDAVFARLKHGVGRPDFKKERGHGYRCVKRRVAHQLRKRVAPVVFGYLCELRASHGLMDAC